MSLADQIVSVGRSYQNVQEDPRGSNSGPLVNDWLAFVHASPGDPWCAAYACVVVHEARALERLPPLTFLRSGSAMRLWLLNQALATDDPQPGDLIIFDHGHGMGHVAIKTGSITAIAGNTSPDGTEREGYGVFEHGYDPTDRRIAGYIRVR